MAGTAITDALTAIATEVGALEDERAALREERDVLLARIDAMTQRRPMLVGASITPRGAQSHVTATAAFVNDVGPVGIARRFHRTFSASVLNTNAAQDIGVRSRALSFKGDPTLADWRRLLQTVPDDGHLWYLIPRHEPDNGDMDGPTYKARCDLALRAMEETGRDDIIPTVILMSYLERDGNPATSSRAYFPSEPSKWVLGLDPYDGSGTRDLDDLVGQTLDLWREDGGKRWGLGETATAVARLPGQPGRTPESAAQWVTRNALWAHAEGCEFMCWFHSGIGVNAPPQGWWMDDPQVRAAWRALGTRVG